jgi:hypothetical protein
MTSSLGRFQPIGAVGGRYDDLPVDDRAEAALMYQASCATFLRSRRHLVDHVAWAGLMKPGKGALISNAAGFDVKRHSRTPRNR